MSAPRHDELLPCPFCGEKPNLTTYRGNYNRPPDHVVHCDKCDLSLDGSASPAEAVELWNRRTPIAAPGAGAVTEAMVERGYRYLKSVVLDNDTNIYRFAKRTLEAALRPDEAAGQGEAETPITQEEMASLFGEEMPVAAVNLLWNSPPDWTVGKVRQELRKLATPRPASPVAPDIVPVAWRYETKDGVRYAETRLEHSAKLAGWLETPLYGPEALTALSSELAETKRERDELDALLNEGGSWELQLTKAEARAEAAEAEAARLAHALETATTFSAEIKGALEARIEELTAEVARLTRELESVRTNSELRLARLIEANDLLDELRAEVARLKAREKEYLDTLSDADFAIEATLACLNTWNGGKGGPTNTEGILARIRALQPAEKDSTDEA